MSRRDLQSPEQESLYPGHSLAHAGIMRSPYSLSRLPTVTTFPLECFANARLLVPCTEPRGGSWLLSVVLRQIFMESIYLSPILRLSPALKDWLQSASSFSGDGADSLAPLSVGPLGFILGSGIFCPLPSTRMSLLAFSLPEVNLHPLSNGDPVLFLNTHEFFHTSILSFQQGLRRIF